MGAPDVKIYDANQVTVTFAALLIDSGYADGDFVKIEQDSDDFTDVVGTDGEVTRSKTNDRRITVTLSLMQTSSGNSALTAINQLDRSKPNGAGIAPLMIRDKSGTALYVASKAWISKPPDVSFGKEAGPREWKLRAVLDERVDGGS